MKIKKFEAHEEYSDYDYGGHVFVLARYKDGWNKFPYRTGFKDAEFVPCLISGFPTNKWQKGIFGFLELQLLLI